MGDGRLAYVQDGIWRSVRATDEIGSIMSRTTRFTANVLISMASQLPFFRHPHHSVCCDTAIHYPPAGEDRAGGTTRVHWQNAGLNAIASIQSDQTVATAYDSGMISFCQCKGFLITRMMNPSSFNPNNNSAGTIVRRALEMKKVSEKAAIVEQSAVR